MSCYDVNVLILSMVNTSTHSLMSLHTVQVSHAVASVNELNYSVPCHFLSRYWLCLLLNYFTLIFCASSL